MGELPETILQVGSGKFLRGFADLFIHHANQQGQRVGRVVVVQTTGEGRANLLRQQGGRYHVLVRGLSGGAVVDRVEESASISRALVASRQWDEVLAVARSPDLRFLLSNTAEAGYTLDPSDRPDAAPPSSFPAKLLLLLRERFQAGLPGVTILPCELFEHNADTLRGIVLQLADQWKEPEALKDWVREQCAWRNCLVDRIVTVPSEPDPRVPGDALVVAVEPYALWAIEVREGGDGGLPRHPAIQVTTDVQPFFLRKVRILNAAHTALVTKAVPRGIATVREAVSDPEIEAWLKRLLFDEIVPVLRGRAEEPEAFAEQTLERFRNPFLVHKVSDILVYHEQKVRIRLVPTRAEFAEKFGRMPPLLDEAIAASASLSPP
ncbi:MAG: altronate dehydrogenase [Planctomycetes bacterium]|nr:altronate dehydrogenase [Planctomycetota bacterium]